MDFGYLFKKYWGTLAGLGLFIFGILSAFLNPPPPYVTDDESFVNFGKFVAVVVCGLVLAGVIIFKSKAHMGKWWALALIMLILAASSYFAYQNLSQKYTCTCLSKDKLIMIGDTLINPDLPDVARHRNECTELLIGSACDPYKVWTKDSIDRNRLILAGAYTLSLPLLITAMMAVVQALYCAQKDD